MLSYEETVHRMAQSAAVVKLITGVANNASWLVMLEGLKHARQCPTYRQMVKRNFKAAMQAMQDYKKHLIHNQENRMFHLADMTPEIRKKYGNISDSEYYDFWANMGVPAYEKTLPLLTSLQNKYRLSLVREHVPQADHVAWVMTAMAALELAVQMYHKAVDECVNGYSLPRKLVEDVFGQFNLQHVSNLWRKALVSLSPQSDKAAPDHTDARNIEHGLVQLCEAWSSPTLLYSSTMDTVHEYSEIFRTAGEQKKAMRNIATAQSETEQELREMRNERLKIKN